MRYLLISLFFISCNSLPKTCNCELMVVSYQRETMDIIHEPNVCYYGNGTRAAGARPNITEDYFIDAYKCGNDTVFAFIEGQKEYGTY